jgi:nucleoside-diphosphate-sugar epimerase
MKILITGATGYIGYYLSERLATEGYEVIALVRKDTLINKKEDIDKLYKIGIKIIHGDLLNISTLKDISLDVDVVYHLAAVFVENRKNKLTVKGTKNLLDILKNRRIKKFIFTSNNLVYGPTRRPAIETDSCKPNTLHGKNKLLAEQLIINEFRKNKFPGVIFRISQVYGGSRSSFNRIILKKLQDGKLPIIGSGKNKIGMVYIQDVIDALTSVLSYNDINGEIFNICSGDIETTFNIYNYLSNIIGSPHPKKVLKIGAYLFSTFHMINSKFKGAEPELNYDLIKIFTMDRTLDIKKSKEMIEYNPKFNKILDGLKKEYSSWNSGSLK